MLLKGITVLSVILAVLETIGGAIWVLPLHFIRYFAILFAAAFVFLVVVSYGMPRGELEKEREKDSPFYRWVVAVYVEALIQIMQVRVTATGLEKTPKDGRFLLVCNHQFAADPGILLHYFKDSQLAFISKKENRKLFCVGPLMHMILCQELDREDDRQGLRVILKCIRLIKEDKVSIGVFPEGGTNHDDKLHPFRPGVFKIAQKANVPIVVCTLNNTRPIIHNAMRLKKTEVQLHLLDVIPAEELAGKTTVEIADRVHGMMLADLGEEFRSEA